MSRRRPSAKRAGLTGTVPRPSSSYSCGRAPATAQLDPRRWPSPSCGRRSDPRSLSIPRTTDERHALASSAADEQRRSLFDSLLLCADSAFRLRRSRSVSTPCERGGGGPVSQLLVSLRCRLLAFEDGSAPVVTPLPCGLDAPGRPVSVGAESLPCRRSWVRVPSSAPQNPLETASFRVLRRRSGGELGQPGHTRVTGVDRVKRGA